MALQQLQVTISLTVVTDADVSIQAVKDDMVAEARRYLAASQWERDTVHVEVTKENP